MTEVNVALIDAPPSNDAPTEYDWAHRVCYLRLLDADADGADWREVARVVMGLDPQKDPEQVHRTWRNHLDRAIWMTTRISLLSRRRMTPAPRARRATAL